jgi:hypothetical protein
MLIKDFQIPSEHFVKMELKRMLHEYDGKIPVQDQVLVEQQIDDMDFKSWMADQRQALLGAPPTSPGEQQKPKQDTMALGDRELQSMGGGERTSATVKVQV